MEILNTAYGPNKLISAMEEADDPYKLLVSCLLSLRTKDEVTYPAAKRLFKLADTPQKMIDLQIEVLEKTIYPVGFYHNKSKVIIDISRVLLEQYEGKVPNTMEELLSLKGVGRKTANLVLARGFRIPAICVDTHVHRITNRLGYLSSSNPTETEMILRDILPKKWWFIINTALVRHGQETCKPINPKCNYCKVDKYCLKLGIKKKNSPKTTNRV